MNEEQKYNEFRRKLRSLPKIHAPGDFENKLFQRIRLEKETNILAKHRRTEHRKSWILNMLKQPAFAPALAFGSVVIVGLVIYLAFFTQNEQQEITSQQTPGIEKQYSVTQLESLRYKVGNLGTENHEFAKREEEPPASMKRRTEVSEHRSDFESKATDVRIEEQTRTEDVPSEKTSGPERMEKKETPFMGKDKLEEKGKLDETLGKGIMPSNEKEVIPSKGDDKIEQNQAVSEDTTKSKDTGRKKKSKKKEKKSEIPPVEQKIQDTITK